MDIKTLFMLTFLFLKIVSHTMVNSHSMTKMLKCNFRVVLIESLALFPRVVWILVIEVEFLMSVNRHTHCFFETCEKNLF